MRVLLTNATLADRSGTEVYVRDVALRLQALGHTPLVYSTKLGAVAAEIRNATIPVISDLDALAVAPDVIHGHHHVETMTALLRFPDVPAVYFCHDWYREIDAPPPFPRILRYVAVDRTCYDKLVYEHAVPEERVRMLLNFVDLERFKPRPPLPPRPKRALLFSNYAENDAYLKALRDACNRAHVTLDVVGARAGTATERPESVIAKYDLVFAKARSALEALAIGTAVVIFFAPHAGPMVTAAEIDRLLPLNLGVRAMRQLFVAPEELALALDREIARYDPADAAEVSRRVRATAGIDSAVDDMIALYQEVIAEQKALGPSDIHMEGRAAAAYLRHLHAVPAALEDSVTFRLRDRILRIPILRTVARSIARLAAG
jgi:hypothetical protein